MTVGGMVVATATDTSGIFLGDINNATATGHRVTVASSGYVEGAGAEIVIFGDSSRVENHGVVRGEAGIGVLSASLVATNVVINTGQVIGEEFGVTCGDGGTGLRLFNSGLISSEAGASNFAVSGSDDSTDIVTNTAVIRGNINLYDGADTYIGKLGTLFGDLNLEFGADTYDGRGGSVDGMILGDAGNDFFIVGADQETIDGGADVDSLDFKGSNALVVALDGSVVATGFAAGDTYSNIENVYGSVYGADFIRGSSAVNLLVGRGGNDNLQGMGGGDTLIGGLGVDTLSGGGAGNDTFRYDSLSERGDLISDFSSNAAGNNDRFLLKGSAFGFAVQPAGTYAIAGGAFIIRADNLAQQADDRFIFRTTDKTLWFDSNGNVAGGLSMIADLQATATMTSGDIFFYF